MLTDVEREEAVVEFADFLRFETVSNCAAETGTVK